LTDRFFHHRADDIGQHERCRFIVELSHEIAYPPKKEHDDHIDRVVINAVGADHTDYNDEWRKQRGRHLDDLDEKFDQRNVKNEQDEITHVHAGDDAPEDLRVLLQDEGPGGHAMENKSPEQEGHDTIGWNP
jgi:hypothetical protein